MMIVDCRLAEVVSLRQFIFLLKIWSWVRGCFLKLVVVFKSTIINQQSYGGVYGFTKADSGHESENFHIGPLD